jgi:hypothetical protein
MENRQTIFDKQNIKKVKNKTGWLALRKIGAFIFAHYRNFSYLCPSMFNLKIYTIMKKKEMKSQKVQELTAEELEQANGGNVTIDDILKSTTAILMFP